MVAAETPVRTRRAWPWLEFAVAALAAAVLLRPVYDGVLARPALRSWSTVFVSIGVQAMPFLVLGVVVSGAIAAWVRPEHFARIMPRSPVAAVPMASVAGAFLPGCECGSVPIAGRLVRRGVAPAAALAFLLSAPAINPVVLVATATAFPGQPEVVVARAVASLLASIAVGYVWAWRGNDSYLARAKRHQHEHASRLDAFVSTVQHDFLQAGGFLVIGAATAASLQTFVPRGWLENIAGSEVQSVLFLALLAVALSICSEGDAFVAAGLTQFSLTSRLAFLVVGPMVDVKLVALQAGTFGRPFASRFAPLTFVAAIGAALLAGAVLL